MGRITSRCCILVPRGCTPFSQHQVSWPLGRSNAGSLQFTDFTSNLANETGWEYKYSMHVQKIDSGFSSRSWLYSWCWLKQAGACACRPDWESPVKIEPKNGNQSIFYHFFECTLKDDLAAKNSDVSSWTLYMRPESLIYTLKWDYKHPWPFIWESPAQER